MRLDKFIANNSGYSRSDVKRLIKNKAIAINQILASSSDQQISIFVDNVTINDERICPQAAQYYMVHKPVNVVCANIHSGYPTVLDLLVDIPFESRSKLQIAGRLDVDTTGLVLITDDGQWNHKVTSPRSDCFKIYEVELAEPFDQTYISAFESGMLLTGEDKPTLAAKIEIIDDFHLRLGICEGRYHQVKRMCQYANNQVVKLHRSSIGPLQLDTNLQPGEYRPLTSQEINALADLKSDANDH